MNAHTRDLAPLPATLPGGYGRGSYVVSGQTPRLVRGRGAMVTDENGRELIDANNNFAVLVLGHGHQAVTDAVRRTLDSGTCFGLANGTEPQLAEEIVTRIDHAEQARFTNSGTEAVMTAIRAARAATGRSTIIGVMNSYHGSSDAALAIRYGPEGSGIPRGAASDVRSVDLNDLDSLIQTVAAVEHDLAAIIIDLLPNYAGLRQVSEEFAATARRICDRTGAYLVFDEIISLRAEVGGLQARYDVAPDLTTLGKLIGGGLPIGAVVGSRDALDPLSPFSDHAVESSGTFTGNPVSTSAGLACLRSFGADEISHINDLGHRLRSQLSGGLDGDWEVRGTASLVRVMPAYGMKISKQDLWWAAYERGVLMMPTGLMALSTPMTTDTVDAISETVVQAVAAVAQDPE